ncbi:MAG: hypothetical protein U5R48_09950 [Gammaproteobacteria bacterium]|nr:hypothetical protein [Gammaproteobacteria bacterium]
MNTPAQRQNDQTRVLMASATAMRLLGITASQDMEPFEHTTVVDVPERDLCRCLTDTPVQGVVLFVDGAVR